MSPLGPRIARRAFVVAVVALALLPSSAMAGRLVTTGHDADSHCSGYDNAGQCHFIATAVNYVRAGSTKPLLLLDCSTTQRLKLAINNALGAATAAATNTLCPTNPAFAGDNLSQYSAIVVGSSLDKMNIDGNPRHRTRTRSTHARGHRDLLQCGRWHPSPSPATSTRTAWTARPTPTTVHPDSARWQVRERAVHAYAGGHRARLQDSGTASGRTTTSTAARRTTPSRSLRRAAPSRSPSATAPAHPRRCSPRARSAAARSSGPTTARWSSAPRPRSAFAASSRFASASPRNQDPDCTRVRQRQARRDRQAAGVQQEAHDRESEPARPAGRQLQGQDRRPDDRGLDAPRHAQVQDLREEAPLDATTEALARRAAP